MALFQHDPGQGGEQREANGEGNQFFLPQHRANTFGGPALPEHSNEVAGPASAPHSGLPNGED